MNLEFVYGMLGLILAPGIFNAFKNSAQHRLFIVIVTVPFVAGSLDILGLMNETDTRFIVELLIMILFIKTFLESPRFKLPNLTIVVLFTVTMIWSSITSEVPYILQILFFRKYFITFLLYYSLANLDFSSDQKKRYFKYIWVMFLLQIILGFGKYFLFGQGEPRVGSLSNSGGSLTAIVTLVGVGIAYVFYHQSKKSINLLFILGFILFGIIGEKRAILFYVPLLLFPLYFVISLTDSSYINLKLRRLVVLSSFLFGVVFLTISLNPSLNPEHIVGGTVDFEFFTNEVERYLNPRSAVVTYYGRGEAPSAVIEKLYSSGGFFTLLFGFGPGDLIMSRFNTEIRGDIGKMEDIISQKYDIGYGARTGFLWTTLQIGLLGSLLYALFYVKLTRSSLLQIKKNPKNIFVHLALVFGIVFLIDYFSYSTVFFNILPINLSFLILVRFSHD